MSWLHRLSSIFRAFLRRDRVEKELDSELRTFIDLTAEEKIRDGIPSAEAYRLARLELGGIAQAKERVRTERHGALLEEAVRDVLHTLRIFRKAPGFVFAVVLTLTLGIGANTALFTLMNAAMLKSLPVREPGQLFEIRSGRRTNFSNPIWEQIRDRRDMFDGAVAYSTERHDLASGGETHFIDGMEVNGDYFAVLGVHTAIGRTFSQADDRRGCGEDGRLAVISHSFWQRHFGGSMDVLGKDLTLDGRRFTIVGVTERGFFGVRVGQSFDVATPLCGNSYLDDRGRSWLRLVARLKPGVTAGEAERNLRAAQPAIREETRPPGGLGALSGRNYLADPFQLLPASTGTSSLRDRYAPALKVLMALAGIVLLVTCGNVAAMLLSRATARTREIAIRISLGASRSRLIRQLLIESIVLSLLGASIGLLFAPAASGLLIRNIPSGVPTRVFIDVGLDWRVLTFTIVAGTMTGLVFGIVPAIRATRSSPGETLAEFTTRSTARRSVAGGKWLVSFQIAASLVLLFGAALFVRSYWRLATADHGFDSERVLLLITGSRTGFSERAGDFPEYAPVLEAVRAVPGVQSAAYSFTVPVGESQGTLNIRTAANGAEPRESDVWMNTISPGYFKTFDTPIIAGRDFDPHEAVRDGVVIVNEAFVRELLNGGDAIGKTFEVRSPRGWVSTHIVGVVRDTKYITLREAVQPMVYTPEEAMTHASGVISLKTSGNALASAPAVVNAISGVNKKMPLTVRTFQSVVDESMAQEQLMATLSIFFGVLALIIASVGLAGLVSYSVTRRYAEIGIRSALGATRKSLLALMMRDVLLMTAGGILVGSISGLAAARSIRSMLYEITPSDPITLALSVAALASVALIAGYIPARRAAKIDPMQCLRGD